MIQLEILIIRECSAQFRLSNSRNFIANILCEPYNNRMGLLFHRKRVFSCGDYQTLQAGSLRTRPGGCGRQRHSFFKKTQPGLLSSSKRISLERSCKAAVSRHHTGGPHFWRIAFHPHCCSSLVYCSILIISKTPLHIDHKRTRVNERSQNRFIGF